MDYKNNLVKPVLFMVFNRPEKTKIVWDEIRKAQPRKLYISIDGPRQGVDADIVKCKKVRDIVYDVDWECDVKYLDHDKNKGCSLAGKTAFDWVFRHEQEMIQLEDDVVPTQSFFWFMQEMLEKYKNNDKICYVCAENYGIKNGNATYFFSQYGGSWGWATWKRVYDKWEYKLDSLEHMLESKAFRNNFSSKFEYDYWVRAFKSWKYIGGNTYDLQTIYLIRKESMMNIIPNINLVTNIGWDLEASNTKVSSSHDPAAQKFGNIPSFEIDKIVHPDIIEISKETDNKWFKYHFQNRSKISYRLRWFLGNFLRKLKVIK